MTFESWSNQQLRQEVAQLRRRVAELEDLEEQRRRAGEELRNELNSFFHVATDLMCVVSPAKGCFLKVNPACLKILGRSAEEMCSRPIEEFIHQDDRESTTLRLAKQLEGDSVAHFENRCRHKDGSYRRLSWMATPAIDGQVFAVATDVDQRRRKEEALRESEERFRLLFEYAPDAYYINDFTGTFIGGNRAAENIIGVQRNQLIGKNFLDLELLPPDQLARAAETLASNMAGHATGPDEFTLNRVCGGQVPVEISTVPCRLAGQSVVLGIARDITERKRTEEELHEQAETIRAIVDTTQDWIWSIDLQGVHTFSNPAVERILGYRPAELVGRPSFELMHEEDRRIIETEFPRWIANKQGWQGRVIRWMHRDGSCRYLESSAVAVIDVDGEIVGFRGVDRDITGRKQAEEENAVLQEQLLQSQKMEAIGRLAGGVAHDINNMLSGIMGYASLVQMDLESDDHRAEDIGEILAICNKARDLTGNLLGFARKGKYRRERIDLNDSISRTRQILERTISKKVEIETRLAENLSKVEGDPGQIDQVLMNLGINAADAMPDGGRLTLRTREFILDEVGRSGTWDLKPGRYVEVVVTDDGTGMTPEILERVFEPFFTTKALGQGTGLGLSMVYGTIRNHGGSISLVSEPDQGTTVLILLPALGSSGEDAVQASDRPPVAVPTGQGMILLVDDEETVRTSTARLLETMGYRVIQAVDGADALDKYREKPNEIALVLLDMVMPVMDGPETFRKLEEINPGVRALLISGFSADSAADGLINEGAIGFIQKPFLPDKLAAAVANALASGTD